MLPQLIADAAPPGLDGRGESATPSMRTRDGSPQLTYRVSLWAALECGVQVLEEFRAELGRGPSGLGRNSASSAY
jgi:hypothetical protein